MSRPYGNKISNGNYVNRKRQTIATDWNDVSDDIEALMAEVNKLKNIIKLLDVSEITNFQPVITNDIEVFDVEQGLYYDDNIISSGTPIEDILKNMLQKVIHPTYVKPTCSIGSNILNSRLNNTEMGTSISDILNITWNQNNAGQIESYTIEKNNVVVYSGNTSLINSYNSGNWVLNDTDVVFKLTINYTEGDTLLNNLNIEDSYGKILNGSISSSITYKGNNNKIYIRCDNETSQIITESDLKNAGITNPYTTSIQDFIINKDNLNNFEISFNGLAKRIIIAIPKEFGEINQIQDLNLFNGTDILDTFTKIQMSITNDNNNSITKEYYIYYSIFTAVQDVENNYRIVLT